MQRRSIVEQLNWGDESMPSGCSVKRTTEKCCESRQVQPQRSRRQMADPPAVWQSVGRGTPAGRALFNLFSDDVNGRQTGDKFSARNKAVLEAKVAMGWRPTMPGDFTLHCSPPCYLQQASMSSNRQLCRCKDFNRHPC